MPVQILPHREPTSIARKSWLKGGESQVTLNLHTLSCMNVLLLRLCNEERNAGTAHALCNKVVDVTIKSKLT